MTVDGEYGLVMPFVVCQSKGGPYDDDAFVAGYQAGSLSVTLSQPIDPGGMTVTVRTDLVPQVDLIAMHHQCVTASEPCTDADGWSFVTIRPEQNGR